jgi:hypothetical protein
VVTAVLAYGGRIRTAGIHVEMPVSRADLPAPGCGQEIPKCPRQVVYATDHFPEPVC